MQVAERNHDAYVYDRRRKDEIWTNLYQLNIITRKNALLA